MIDPWKAKLAAWVHDPIEKALILLRTKEGHEAGTVAQLRRKLFENDLPAEIQRAVKKADHWASACDRPQFPHEVDEGGHKKVPKVNFAKTPELVHPLSGQRYQLNSLDDLSPKALKALSVDVLDKLIVATDDGAIDYRKTFLSFWRLAPYSGAPEIGHLWRYMPADTRIPDHSIWEHLRLTSAFASCFTDPSGPALLTMSIGPVQSFIAQARSTSDLWAGSHLLATLSWQAMQEVCSAYGPDSILFPDLWGVPIVDLWLQEQGVDFEGISERQEARFDWRQQYSDQNPLFTAALPNRFLALVPASAVEGLVGKVQDKLSAWVKDHAHEAWHCLLEKAGVDAENSYADEQIARQLEGFPELQWSSVPWSLADGQSNEALELALAKLGGEQVVAQEKARPLWRLATGDISLEETSFFHANPGAYYPALFNAVGLSLDGAKRLRKFNGNVEEGFRCSLCGEREWLSLSRERVLKPRGEENPGQPWGRLNSPSLAKRGEHLCALCSLKRLWPTLFCHQVRECLPKDQQVNRYVVSTHTMALVPTMQALIKNEDPEKFKVLTDLLTEGTSTRSDEQEPMSRVALPAGLNRELEGYQGTLKRSIRKIPAWIEHQSELQTETAEANCYEGELKKVLKNLGAGIQAYYGMLLFDGDRMGKWLAGEADGIPSTEKLWHSSIKKEAQRFAEADSTLKEIIEARRSPSIAFHGAISRSLNQFAIASARRIVEQVYSGKVIYAGGDDLLAMVPVTELAECMMAVRWSYSGVNPWGCDEKSTVAEKLRSHGIVLNSGFVHDKEKRGLYRTMGEKATASTGAVVAHCMTPMSSVLNELRSAEGRAKTLGDRDAFSLSVMKRSGGTIHLTSKWRVQLDEDNTLDMLALIVRLSKLFSSEISRSGVYRLCDWLQSLPEEAWSDGKQEYEDMLTFTIESELKRHIETSRDGLFAELKSLSRDISRAAIEVCSSTAQQSRSATQFIEYLLLSAEFLGRCRRECEGERA